MPNASLTCKYCGASNPAGTDRCTACGAPIDIPVMPPVTVTTINTPARTITPPVNAQRADTTPEQINDALDAAPLNDQLKEGLKAASMGIGTLGVGTFFARTASEAAAIAFSTFMVGYYSAATHNSLLALAGGLIIGLIVGLAVKRPLGALLSAPIGTLIGLVAGHLLQASFPKLAATRAACVGWSSLVRHHRQQTHNQQCCRQMVWPATAFSGHRWRTLICTDRLCHR